MHNRRGFTLVEMLVVIGIIGILIVALVPAVQNAQERAKEAAISTNCANIEASLANYAQNHGGNYPGTAIDVMAPWADYGLGDPAIYTKAQVGDDYNAAPGYLVAGVLGGFGHDNQENGSTNVFEQLKNVKDLDYSTNTDEPRYFDSMIISGAIQDYPSNQLVTTAGGQRAGERAKMTNIFRFWCDMTTGPDFDTPDMNPGSYDVGVIVQPNNELAGGMFNGDDDITGRPILNNFGTVPAAFGPLQMDSNSPFGGGEYGGANDAFAPGDFAYVPVLTASASPMVDASATIENERYRWGTNVGGYLLFGYGNGTTKGMKFEDEAREFYNTGLPGYGNNGVDTKYELAVLQLFNGAVFFSKKL